MQVLNSEFKAANNYLEQLAFISSHDLKSPIHTLNGLIDLMMKSKTAAPGDIEIMRLEKKVILQMQQTNNGLNDILKLRQGLLSKEHMNSESMALAKIIDAIKVTLQQDLAVSGGELHINLNGLDKVPFPFLYMQSMLYNLVTNAIKFRDPDRSLVINLQAKRSDKNGFQFIISDNGLGFDMVRSKTKLFGIFKRFHPQIEGTGIGLHIVKSIVDAFGGDIAVSSDAGKGTEFKITIINPITN